MCCRKNPLKTIRELAQAGRRGQEIVVGPAKVCPFCGRQMPLVPVQVRGNARVFQTGPCPCRG